MRTIKTRHFTGTTDNTVTKRELENRKVARKAAAEGMVLLKNEGQLLPLKEGTKVALYGVGASRTIKGGTGSGDVNERGQQDQQPLPLAADHLSAPSVLFFST